MPSLSGKVSALPTEEVIVFPLGAVIETKIKKVRALCRLGISENGCKRKPLSAQGATLPEGESFSAEWEDKRYVSFNLPSGKAIFPDSGLKQTRYITINYNKLQIFTKVGL